MEKPFWGQQQQRYPCTRGRCGTQPKLAVVHSVISNFPLSRVAAAVPLLIWFCGTFLALILIKVSWFFVSNLFFFLFFLFLGLHLQHMEVPRLGVQSELCCRPTLQPNQCQIWAGSATYTTAHGNTGSIIHWARPGTEPATSWLLARLVSIAPRRELLNSFFDFGLLASPVIL